MREKTLLALQLIVPYLVDPTTCGYDPIEKRCEYLTRDGRMCVAGKCMIDPGGAYQVAPIDLIMRNTNVSVFKPEYTDKFTPEEWRYLQGIHDNITTKQEVEDFRFFSPEELIIYVLVNDMQLSHAIIYNP